MPDDRRPSIVQHPLNDPGGLILIAAVGLIHRAHAFVGLELRLEGEIFGIVCFAVARIQSIGKYMNIFERATTRVVIPEVINWPEMVFRQHCAHALNRRNGRPHAGFSVEPVSAAAAAGIAFVRRIISGSVLFPVTRRDIFVRSGHLDAALAGVSGQLCGCR